MTSAPDAPDHLPEDDPDTEKAVPQVSPDLPPRDPAPGGGPAQTDAPDERPPSPTP